MKKTCWTVLWLIGWLINIATAVSAFIYATGCILWLHAPVIPVLFVTVTMMAPFLALAWICKKARRGLGLGKGGRPTTPGTGAVSG
jgi:hypothetical protein